LTYNEKNKEPPFPAQLTLANLQALTQDRFTLEVDANTISFTYDKSTKQITMVQSFIDGYSNDKDINDWVANLKDNENTEDFQPHLHISSGCLLPT
jgi:hypothetical protein